MDVNEDLKFCENSTKKNRGGGGVLVGMSGCGCERRIEVIVEMKKNRVGGFRSDR